MFESAKPADYLTPLVIGVTGHRDLVPDEIGPLREMVSLLFAELRHRFPNTPLCLMTALAEGADRLAAHAALDTNVGIRAILPMPADDYRTDFKSQESRAEFDALCARADVIELPMTPAQQRAILSPGADRDMAYANAGMFISAHCHILLALWDGIQARSVGGTSQIVYFQHYDRLPGVAEKVPRTSLFLTDDESDLVYHISCSRRRENNEKAMPPLEACWFTTDPVAPRLQEMPSRYIRVFAQTDEYNRDIQHFLGKHSSIQSSEADPPATDSRMAAVRIRRYFDIADHLANFFQRRVDATLRCTYALALLTGLAFIFYSELDGLDPLIYAFLAFLLVGIFLAGVAKRLEWHRKYLDYRVLAEGLRVQYYWTIASVRGEGHTKFAYDNFLRQRDMELGWIRNVMRVAGILSDARPGENAVTGLKFAVENWIGTAERPGQLDYYRRKSVRRSRVNRLIALVTMVCLWSGIMIAFVLAFSQGTMAPDAQKSLIIMMGVLPLVAGVAEVYTQRKADRELVKQYQFMEHVFANARRRLDQAATDAERREVLHGLGEAALSEHAEWILVHRERQPEPSGL